MKTLTTFIYEESSDRFSEYVSKLQKLKEFADKYHDFWYYLHYDDEEERENRDDHADEWNDRNSDKKYKEEEQAYDKYKKAKDKLEKEYAKEAEMFNQIAIHAITPKNIDKLKDSYEDKYGEEEPGEEEE